MGAVAFSRRIASRTSSGCSRMSFRSITVHSFLKYALQGLVRG